MSHDFPGMLLEDVLHSNKGIKLRKREAWDPGEQNIQLSRVQGQDLHTTRCPKAQERGEPGMTVGPRQPLVQPGAGLRVQDSLL